MKNKKTPTTSVCTVTPVFTGEKHLPELVSELAALRESWETESCPVRLTEAVFVDDGAIDNSSNILSKLSAKHSWVRVISLSRNYGQHAATVAGICHTSSDWVVTLDEDLQHRPAMINKLFECQTKAGLDVVYANPVGNTHGHSWRDRSSRVVKQALAKATSTPQIKIFNSFRLIRGSIARAAASSSSSSTYFDIAVSWFTKSCDSIELELSDKRFINNNESGYGLIKLIGHARRLIVSSEVDVASSGLVLGIGSVVFASLIAFLSVIQKLFFPETVGLTGWTSLITVVTFFSGVVIALLCIALEYLNIVTLSSLGRPTFFTVDRSQDQHLIDWFQVRSKK